ncbi:MAG TPA: hypothetical protein VFC04_09135 [Actinomycetota bacterium]|nr:hypothetical protein [Actinomycetota bacterium]
MGRSVGRRNGHRSFLQRVLGRAPRVRDDFAEDLRERVPDVWRALRF